jgi:hypothetical protein
MFGRTFYHDTLRKYVILFGTLFNDVWINREDSDGNVINTLKVPLTYGPRDKHLARIQGLTQGYDPQDQEFAIVVPRMGFEITGMNYAPERKLPTINRFVVQDIDGNNQRRQYQYNPVPYDIAFSLSIFVKNSTDGTRIVEQILPYFTPEWNTTVQLIETPDVTLDVPLVLQTTSMDEVYEGSYEDRRTIIWNLEFVMKCQFYGPVYKQPVIKLANTQIFDVTLYDDINDGIGQVDPAAKIINQPGLLANNQPTIYTDLNVIQASAVAIIENGSVTGIAITDGGRGYSEATITITGGGGANAEATATIGSGDSITQITVTDGGSGYTSTPTVNISIPDLTSLDADQITVNNNYGFATTLQDPYPES